MALRRLQSLGGPCGESLPHEARARVQGIRSPNGTDTLPLTSELRADIEFSKGFELKANQWRDSQSRGSFLGGPSRLSRCMRMGVIRVRFVLV